MPVSNQAVTLPQYAMESNDPGVKKLVKAILTPYSVLNDIPLATNPALKAQTLRLLPEGLGEFNGWGQLNQAPQYYNAHFEDYQEQAYLVRQLIQVDRRLLSQPGWIGDPFQNRISAWKDLLNYTLNYTFIYNDPGSESGNPLAWTGLRPRMRNKARYKVPDSNRINANGLDLSATLSPASANELYELLGIAFARVGAPGGANCSIYCNFLSKERMATGTRKMGAGAGWRITEDAFGREVEMFRQAKVTDLGFRQDSETPIILNTETTTGDESEEGDRTSLFVVHYGEEYFRGWQTNPLKPEYLGRSTEYGTFENVLIDWAVGLMQPHPRSVVEIYNLKIQ